MKNEMVNESMQMEEAFEVVDIKGVETPQKALNRVKKIAEKCWNEASYQAERPQGGSIKAHDPVKTMQSFESLVREDAALILAVVGERYWHALIRTFLEQASHHKRAWSHSHAFRTAMKKRDRQVRSEKSGAWQKRRKSIDSEWALQKKSVDNISAIAARKRKAGGIKRLAADIDIKTGLIVNLIDKEFGPFAHIRVNGLRLAEVTTQEALWYCDHKMADVKFVRALCQLIPDPRKPIGEQWTADIIRQAKSVV